MIDPALLLQFATPLLLAALGELVLERSGILNLGLEGSMLLAAFVATIVALDTGSLVLGFVAGGGAGLLLTLVVATLAVGLRADQVVAGTAATLLAMGATSILFRARFGSSGSLLSVPERLTTVFGIDVVMALGMVLVPVMGFGLARTRWGLGLRACGEFPPAASAAGLSVSRIRLGAATIAGALAGLAGAYLALGIVGSFGENMVAGRGFVAIAMVTFGRWRPWLCAAGCLLMGYLESLQSLLQAKGVLLPYQLMIALPYLVALLVLCFWSRAARAPGALGKPLEERT